MVKIITWKLQIKHGIELQNEQASRFMKKLFKNEEINSNEIICFILEICC